MLFIIIIEYFGGQILIVQILLCNSLLITFINIFIYQVEHLFKFFFSSGVLLIKKKITNSSHYGRLINWFLLYNVPIRVKEQFRPSLF